MSAKVSKFFNCRVLRDGQLLRGDLWIKGDKVIDPVSVGRRADESIDCRNAIVSPGFIDLQLNGAFGIDFLLEEDKSKGLSHVCRELPRTGVTAFCPTLITSPPKIIQGALPFYRKRIGGAESGATVLGSHLEGPFISKAKRGAHPVECIKDFDEGFKTVVDHYGKDLNDVAIVTIAAEKERSPEVVAEFVKRGVKVSLGHSVVSLDKAEEAVSRGANKITHLFNAMPAFHHRDPSLPGLLVSDYKSKMFYGIIADGVHTHPYALRIAYRMHPEGLCLVTDAIGPMGLPAGLYHLGIVECEVTGSPLRAYVKGTTTLCGSVAQMDFCIKYFRDTTDCSVEFALEAASLHPARCLGIQDRKGHLGVGADADIVMLDDEFNVLQTWVNGEKAFDSLSRKRTASCLSKDG